MFMFMTLINNIYIQGWMSIMSVVVDNDIVNHNMPDQFTFYKSNVEYGEIVVDELEQVDLQSQRVIELGLRPSKKIELHIKLS